MTPSHPVAVHRWRNWIGMYRRDNLGIPWRHIGLHFHSVSFVTVTVAESHGGTIDEEWAALSSYWNINRHMGSCCCNVCNCSTWVSLLGTCCAGSHIFLPSMWCQFPPHYGIIQRDLFGRHTYLQIHLVQTTTFQEFHLLMQHLSSQGHSKAVPHSPFAIWCLMLVDLRHSVQTLWL